jgi:hypothetical protein
MSDTLTAPQVATLWALAFDPADVADAPLCQWKRGHPCEGTATHELHCRACGGSRWQMCDEHAVAIAGEWIKVAARRLRAECGDCGATGPIYSVYVLHTIGGC